MPSGPVYLEQLRRRTKRVLAAGSLLSLVTLAWAAAPRGSVVVDTPKLTVPVVQTKPVASVPALDQKVFAAAIWNPTIPPVPPPPPPPLRLQLVGLSRVTSTGSAAELVALIYDPDADAISEVRTGDSVAGRKVLRVNERGVELSDPTGPRTLSMDDGGSGLGAPAPSPAGAPPAGGAP